MKFMIWKFILLCSFAIMSVANLHAQCGNAYDFYSPDTVRFCAPKVVTFVAPGFPNGTTFEWDIGKGYSAGGPSPQYLFDTSGVYTIKLRATFADNSKCEFVKTDYIKVTKPETPNIQIEDKLICDFTNDSVKITDLTRKTKSRNYFIDGDLYKDATNPFYLNTTNLKTQGVFPLYVEVRDSLGCTSKLILDTFFRAYKRQNPILKSSGSVGCLPLQTNLELSIDTIQNLDTTLWGFSPGIGSSYGIDKVQIDFNDTGIFDLFTEVRTKEGCVYMDTAVDYFKVGFKGNTNVESLNSQLCGSYEIEHTIKQSNVAFDWIISPQNFEVLDSSRNYMKVSYSNIGNYNLSLKGEHNGCVTDTFLKDFATILGPIAGFGQSHSSSCVAPDTFTFWDLTQYPSTGTNVRNWNIYNSYGAKTGTSNKDTHQLILNSLESNSVEFIVSNTNGCSDTLFKKSAIEIKKLKANMVLPEDFFCPKDTVRFRSSTEEGSLRFKNKYKWTFYDVDGTTILNTSTSMDTNMVYDKPGDYSVQLIAYNDLGCIDTLLIKDTIHVSSPKVDVLISDTLICKNDFINFKALYETKFEDFIPKWTFENKVSGSKITVSDSIIDYKFINPGGYDLKFVLKSNVATCEAIVEIPNAFSVQGKKVVLSDSGNHSCEPGLVKLHAKTIVNYGNSDPAKESGEWSVVVGNTTINDPKDSIVYINIKDKNVYQFRYKFVTSNGCQDSTAINIRMGINASFNPSSARPCLYDTVTALKGFSLVKPDEYSWFSDSAHKVTIIDGQTINPKFVFKKTGHTPITTIQKSNQGCSDTVTKIVYILDRQLGITSDDTTLNCAPVVATVDVSTNFANNLWLDYGDGITEKVNQGQNSHLYKVNSGPDGFDLNLIGTDNYGCSDTLFLPGFIRISGPVVDIDIVPNVGCEDFNVLFVNNSKYYKTVISDFGDGVVLDSTDIGRHVYKVFANPVQESFKPVFYFSDGLCPNPFFYRPDDSVVVLKKPEANFTTDIKKGCNPLKVNFKNTSLYAQDYQWDFDRDGVIDSDLSNARFEFTSFGIFKPMLIAKNFNNCYDTLIMEDSIEILASPLADFTVPNDTFCAREQFQFMDLSTGEYKFVKWKWNFGDPNTTFDTSTLQNPIYEYTNSGQNIISLRVEDSLGCWDTAYKSMFIHDTVLRTNPEVKYISIEGNEIFMAWDPLVVNKFDRYVLAEEYSGKRIITYKYDLKDTNYFVQGVNVDTGANCFSVAYIDTCGFTSFYDHAHCNSWLQVFDTVGPSRLKVSWTAYQGWPGDLHYYNIFRSQDGDTFRKIGSVNGNILNYFDDSLCDYNYCYYIEAVHTNGRYKSKSNTFCKKPIMRLPTESVELKRATVLNNEYAFLEWKKDTTLPILGGYVIARNGNSNYVVVGDTNYLDTGSHVDKASYAYRIRVKDHCENYSTYSNTGKTILLSGESGKFTTTSFWTEYREWEKGVSHYDIELENMFGEFEKLATITPSTLEYKDDAPHPELTDSFCYRITAYKQGDLEVISESNIYCIAPNSVIFVPTGFTPDNGDQLNNYFTPFTAYLFDTEGDKLRSYEFNVYNRWGELMFSTNVPEEGWNGHFNGSPAPMGTYLYTLKAVGLDGVAHQKNGYVALIR